MTHRFNTKLLAAVLAAQDEPKAGERFTDARLREALTGGRPLTSDERKLVWFSPDARDHFLRIRRQVRREIREQVREAGLGYMDHRLAASGGAQQEVSGRGFTVTIFHDDIPGEEWSISVQLDPAYRDLLPPSTVVALKDTGGTIWASGVPDDQGRIGGVWEHAGETPHDRLAAHSLVLEP